MNIPVILFLIGMMMVVHYLGNLGFFDAILKRMLKFTKYEPKLMMTMFILLSAAMAALVDEVTSILFMATLVFSTCRRFELNPIPYLIAVIMATNIGSSATVVGNPVGVYTAVYAGLTFTDFLKWSSPAAIVSTFIIVFILLRINRKYLIKSRKLIAEQTINLDEDDMIHTPFVREGALIFITTILLLVFHSMIESVLNLTKNTVLIATPLVITALILIKEREHARELFEKSVDWWTLVFFMFLFSMASTLESTGVTAKLASFLINLLGLTGELTILSTIVTFIVLVIVIGLISAFADNIVAVAALLPVINHIISYNLPSGQMLWWAAVVGGCYFGNLTPIGSTANIVALSLLERRQTQLITFKSWMRISILITIVSTVVAVLYIISLVMIS
jgi:Na+/H+ antiporter NhaD/arsenite permease-like protein